MSIACRRNLLSKSVLIALVIASAFGSLNRVNAGTVMQYFDAGSASWKLIASAPSPTTSVGFFAASGFELYSSTATSNIPGTATGAFLVGTDAVVWNKSGSTATLKLTFGADGFLLPTAPASIQSHIGVTTLTDTSVPVPAAHVSMTSYVDELDRIGNLVFTTAPAPAYTIANVDPVLTSGSGSSDAFATANSLVPTQNGYSVVQQVIVTLANNEKLNFVTNTTISPSLVPEPATAELLGMGLAGMLGYAVKRRWKKGASIRRTNESAFRE
jgi:hypothetical protein